MIANTPKIIVDHTFQLGENPLWDDRRGVLFWTDIDAGQLWRFDPKTKLAEPFYQGPMVGGFTLQHDGKLALFRINDIALINPDAPDHIETIAPFECDDAARFNDVIALPDGGVYAGTIAATPGSGGLYHISQDLTIRQLFLGTDVSNGMAIFNEGRSLLWTCSTSNRIVSYQRNPNDNSINNARDFYRTIPDEGTPDGLARDIMGRVWSARWDGGCVVIHDPTGNPIEKLSVPSSRVTSVCFGGSGLSTLFVTTSDGPLYAASTSTLGFVEHRSQLAGLRQQDRD